LSYSQTFTLFYHYISCLYSYRLWNLLTGLINVIMSHIHIFSIFVAYYPVYTGTELKIINSNIDCNIVLYSYFPNILSLHILYIQLQTLKYINSIINCNIALYSYFPNVMLLNILYIQLQTVKFINCIINCNIVLYSYFPNVVLHSILYI